MADERAELEVEEQLRAERERGQGQDDGRQEEHEEEKDDNAAEEQEEEPYSLSKLWYVFLKALIPM